MAFSTITKLSLAFFVVTATIFYGLSGCTSSKPVLDRAAVHNRGVQPSAVTSPSPGSFPATIKIATFNIQNFGPSKAGRAEVMQLLADTIRRFDVVAVQEISDKSEKAPRVLLALLPGYGLALSQRSGLQADDRSSQEQYAFYFRTNTLRLTSSPHLYDDSLEDAYQREPFIARFRVVSETGCSFVLVNVHTRPESAVEEICALHKVMQWAKGAYPDEDDFIALGDFNAGCTYATPGELDVCAIRSRDYFWIVPDTAESNLAKKRCAYDRIVLAASGMSQFANQWGVEPAFTDKAVSDHLPVWAALHPQEYTNR